MSRLAAQAFSRDLSLTSQPLDFSLPLSTSKTVPQTQYPQATHPHSQNHLGFDSMSPPPHEPPPIPAVSLPNARPLSKSRHSSKHRHHKEDPRTPVSAPEPYTSTPYATQNFSSKSDPRPNTIRRISNSKSGGLNVVLGETESWSELAQKDNTLPADAKELLEVRKRESEKPSGMLGFLSRKKGRGHSPKPMERGILSSKEGGRVVIGPG